MTVSLREPGGEGWTPEICQTTTQPDGEFELALFGVSQVNLDLWKKGFVSVEIPNYVLPASGVPAEFTLQPAYDVSVRVQDARGHPLPAFRVRAEIEGGREILGRRLEKGIFKLENLPAGTARVVAIVSQKEHVRQHDATIPELVIELPVQSGIEVVFSRTEPNHQSSYHLLLQPEGGGGFWLDFHGQEIAEGRAVAEPAPEGRYTVTLRQRVPEDADDDGEKDGWKTLAGPMSLVLVAGELARIEI